MVRQGEADHAKHRTLSVPIQPKLPWIVSRVNLDLNEQRVNVWGKYLEEAKCLCPHCAETHPSYDTAERIWRHLDSCQFPTGLHVTIPCTL